MDANFTKGNWTIHIHPTVNSIIGIDFGDHGEPSFSGTDLTMYNQDNSANAHLIAAAPDMYKMIESLTSELNAAIDEVNTMRDIHHTDNMTPADHWDKENLHDAQVLLAKARGES